MKHVRYADTVTQIAAANWGKKFESDEAAQLEMLEGIDLSGACLLGIVGRIDKFISVFAKEMTSQGVKDSAIRLQERAKSVIDTFIGMRTPDKGPCPDEVMQYLQENIHKQIGRYLLLYGEIPKYVNELPLPPKGTVARKEYDKWMRRKVAN